MSNMYIPEDEVRAALSYKALVPAIRQALIDYSSGRVEQPPRTILRSQTTSPHRKPGSPEEEARNGWFAVMPVISGDVMAVKTVTFYPANAELGLPTHMAMIELLRRSTGKPLAVMDGRLITEMRTAAVSAVALDALAAGSVRSLGILGSGIQARAHLEALRMVRPSLEEVRVWSRTSENAKRFAAETGAHAVVIEEAAACDVVVCVTSSSMPIVEGRWLAPHALVVAVGAIGAKRRELDDEAMLSSCVIAESRDGVERESGDVILSGAKVYCEIGEILAGAMVAPRGGRIVFKSVGMAIEDLTAARLVWAARA